MKDRSQMEKTDVRCERLEVNVNDRRQVEKTDMKEGRQTSGVKDRCHT